MLNSKKKKAKVAILINLMLKMVKRDKEGHYIMAKVSINEKYVAI